MKEKLRGKLPFTVCAVLVLIAAAVFAARLANWQLLHGAAYRQLSTRSTSYRVDTQATRGEILDRNGKGLVTNTTHYKIVIDKLYADDAKLDDTVLKLVSLLAKRASDCFPLAEPAVPS